MFNGELLTVAAVSYGGAVGRSLAVSKDVLVDVVAHCGQVRHVEMPVDLLEAAILVPEVAPLAVGAELLAVELAAVLRLVLVVHVGLLLLVEVQLVILAELLLSVRVLTLTPVAAKARLGPILAHIALVHGSFDEALLHRRGKQTVRRVGGHGRGRG